MTRLGLILAAAMAAGSGCGGNGENGGNGEDPVNPGFVPPDQATVSYTEVANGQWQMVGPSDWSCLGMPSGDVATAIDINLLAEVQDFQSREKIPGATVIAYDDTNFAGSGVATGVSDADGIAEIILPTGGVRWAFKTQYSGGFDTFLLNQYYEPNVAEQTALVRSVSFLTGEALSGFINVDRTPGLGILAGAIRDCNDDEVSGAVATVSRVSGQPDHLEGGATYYFSAGSTSIPVRHHVMPNTNTDGLFVVIELPPASEAYLQVWGYPSQAHLEAEDLVLLGEIPAPIFADSVVSASVEPLRDL